MSSSQRRMPHFRVIDGWRGVSILLVLCGHLVPLGPRHLRLNETSAALGMALFFTLSGFLITSTLLYRPSVREFLIRRVFRIVPLAWLFISISLLIVRAPRTYFFAELLFYANLPPVWLMSITGHLWSLCMEMQFYAGIALLFAIFQRRGLELLPALCLTATLTRIVTHTEISIVTYKRLDEILAGACLALIMENTDRSQIRTLLSESNPLLLLLLAFSCCHPLGGPLNYLRPYMAAGAVGATIVRPEHTFSRFLNLRWLAYIASISFALYVLHPIANHGWLGAGTKAVRYAKRLPAVIVVFALAHLSTLYYERYWIDLGKRWSRRFAARPPQSVLDLPAADNIGE